MGFGGGGGGGGNLYLELISEKNVSERRRDLTYLRHEFKKPTDNIEQN